MAISCIFPVKLVTYFQLPTVALENKKEQKSPAFPPFSSYTQVSPIFTLLIFSPLSTPVYPLPVQRRKPLRTCILAHAIRAGQCSVCEALLSQLSPRCGRRAPETRALVSVSHVLIGPCFIEPLAFI